MSTETDRNEQEPTAGRENRPTRPLSLYLLGENETAALSVSTESAPNIERDRNFLLDPTHPVIPSPHLFSKNKAAAEREGEIEEEERTPLLESNPPIPRMLRPFTDSEEIIPGPYDRGRVDYPLYDGEEALPASNKDLRSLPSTPIVTIYSEPEEDESFGLFHFYLDLARRR